MRGPTGEGGVSWMVQLGRRGSYGRSHGGSWGLMSGPGFFLFSWVVLVGIPHSTLDPEISHFIVRLLMSEVPSTLHPNVSYFLVRLLMIEVP